MVWSHQSKNFPCPYALRQVVGETDNIVLFELAPYLKAEFEKTGRRFSVPENTHWDADTNRIVAETIAGQVERLLEPRQETSP